MNFLTAIFHGALSVAGFVEKEIGYVAQAGTFVRNLEGQLPPATNPKSLYADVLRLLGLADTKIQQVQQIGNQIGGIGPFIQVLQGALAEFEANQPVTGSATIFHPYDYAFTPKAPTA